MSYRLEDQPEWAGPLSEDTGQAGETSPAESFPAPARPAADPALAAIEATIEAERQADMFKSAPPDAQVIS